MTTAAAPFGADFDLAPVEIDRVINLTGKEREVLALVAEGLSNQRIAHSLAVNLRTVETHMSRIFLKLGLYDDPASHRRVLAVLAHLHTHGVQSGDGPRDTVGESSGAVSSSPRCRGVAAATGYSVLATPTTGDAMNTSTFLHIVYDRIGHCHSRAIEQPVETPSIQSIINEPKGDTQ